MKVLMISGDRRMLEQGTEAHERYELQRAQVDELRVMLWGPRNVLGAFGVIAAALSHDFDVVTTQDAAWRGLLGLAAARLGRAKLQVQVHGDLRMVSKIQHMIMQIVLWHADSVRVVSARISAQVEEIGTRGVVHILPVYIDADAIHQAPAADLKKEFPQFGKTVLFIGRLEKEKNCADALRAFADIAEHFPGAGLLVAGTGSEEQALKTLATNYGLSGKVVFLGYRTDTYSLYKAVDCMLVTSLHESWGAAMVEALAAGCPVVAPDVGVAAEAGAIVAARERLAGEVIKVLQSGMRGVIKIPLLTRDQWGQAWRATL